MRRKHGGKRINSGRKPVEDKKIGITVYFRESCINENGGNEAVKTLLYKAMGKVKEFAE